LAQLGAGSHTIRDARSDRLLLFILEKFRSSLILSLNPLFRGILDSKSGKTTQTYIMKVSWPIEAISITSTKKFINTFLFLFFCPISLFQPPIMFSPSRRRLETF
jgi:hypothetical protein